MCRLHGRLRRCWRPAISIPTARAILPVLSVRTFLARLRPGAVAVTNLARGLVAARRRSLLQLVGLFLVFEFEKVGYI